MWVIYNKIYIKFFLSYFHWLHYEVDIEEVGRKRKSQLVDDICSIKYS